MFVKTLGSYWRSVMYEMFTEDRMVFFEDVSRLTSLRCYKLDCVVFFVMNKLHFGSIRVRLFSRDTEKMPFREFYAPSTEQKDRLFVFLFAKSIDVI